MALRNRPLVVALLGLGISASAAAVDIPFETFRLDNGLTVVVHEDRKAPIVAVSVWYHVGSKDERPGKTGFAHLFEHLMFQGSEHLDDEWFKPLEEIGATTVNGTTSFDRTNYFQNVPTTALDKLLWMESDRMGHLLGVIDQARLDEQRGVVQNEKRQGEDAPYGRVFESLQRAIFPEGHPYRWETIGSMADLNAASLDDVKSWFREYYGAANTTLVLAGDIDVATAREKVSTYFGHIPPGPALTRRETWIAPRTESTRDVMYDRVAQPRIYRAWNVPGFATAEADRLELLARVLAGGKTSRLYERLVYREQLADAVSAAIYPFELAGIFSLQADVKNGVDPARVEAILAEELARLVADGPTDDELRRARTALRSGFVRGIERIGGFGGKADVLAECQVYTGDAGCFRASLARLETATADEIAATGRRWLAQGDHTLTVQPQPRYAAAESAVDRAAGPPVVQRFPDVTFPALQRFTLDNGLKVVLAERHEIPVVQFALQFDAGFAADQGRTLGTSGFTLSLLDEGTATRDALAIAAETESLGAQLGTQSTVDTSTVTFSALADRLPESLALFADVVRNPRFEEKEIERVRKLWLAGIAQEKTDPFSVALRLLPPLVFGEGHAYAAPFTGSGTETSIGALTRADLVRFHRDWMRPDNATLIVTGDVTLDALRPLLAKHFGGWRAPAEPRPAKNIAAVRDPAGPRVFLVDQPGTQQAVIIAGHAAPPTGVPNELEIDTMNQVLGGSFNSRINLNLREDKSWSYGAGSFLIGAVGPRPFGVYAPVQIDRTVDSIREIRRELAEFLGARPATREEIERAKRGDVRSLPGQFETAGAVAGAIGGIVRYGRPDDHVATLKARLEAQTDAAIHAAAREVIRPDALTWIVVGDLSRIEQPIRELDLGPVQVMDADGKVLR